MDKWIKDWNSHYDLLHSKWGQLSKKEQQFYIQQLTKTSETLLDHWIDIDEKIALLKEGNFEIQENEKVAYRSKGTSYYNLKMFDRAILQFESERKESRDPLILLYLGFSYLYEKNYEKAKEVFLYILHTATTMYSQHFAYVGLGCLSAQIGYYDTAIDYFEKALSLTKNPDVVYNLGMCHYLENRPRLALPYFEEAIEVIPEDGESYYFKGKCLLLIEENEQAFETWISALQVIESQEILQTLAYEFEWLGHFAAAIHCYKRLEALGFDYDDVKHGIAWNYGLLDERLRAKALFSTLITKNPNNINFWISYLWLLNAWGEKGLFMKNYKLCEEKNLKHPLLDKLTTFSFA